ncbi:MAG TPA: T9SS type A sorting domain-containing protein, partial [Cytophagales bacterium]|nr:T9SS type A sorting domain-containing protein [Cytophagales bacterium]
AYRMQFHHIFTSKAWRYAAASSAEDLSTLTSALLYPNPATQGKVNHNIKGVLKVKAFNTLGAGTELSFDENNIYMDVLSAGVYTLQITTEEGIQIQKLAVE